ncbi:dynein regulatory complex subunit 6-like [Gigantopelta aegis]|uniref:dynein regulatory complex subunit 6-like n=1 Tax=Gigantopelta aegis TaxID=1735272 RepID=UPI001B88AB5C|nr:dynein regulatory complex subunit 6-like [Gigantopelta aegis]XP_041351902.1 dynein regulatory complex subunit 6-like [Gigantopelta aegis]XP_041351903.1 dynein regulatory complex subunit 6-like [Gigantopelta aegis]
MASTREQAKQYLAEHRIPQMFEGLISSLMIERPEDPVVFIERKLAMIKDIGVDNVNWETFVHDLHPYRDALRRRLIRDGSKFDKEYEIDLEMRNKKMDEKEYPEEKRDETYQPDVFQLTEPQA